MGDVGFAELLRWWWGGLLMLLLLACLWQFEPRRMRTALPLVLLLGGLCAHAELTQLAMRWETALRSTAPAAFFQRTFDLPLS